MKKNKFLLSCMLFFGLLIFAGSVSASSIEVLQPASNITYNEELVVNDTARFDSVYIGKQDVGGVTFFNGTIVNNTTTDDVDNPVTFGDNVRIDGILFRTEIGGDNPLKIGDTLKPEANTFDVGTSSDKWRNGYFSGTIATSGLSGTGIVSSTNILNGTVTGSDIDSSTNLTVNNINVSGTVDGVDISDIPSTYISQSSPSWDERTSYVTVPASSCIPESNAKAYTYPSASSGYLLYPTDAGAYFYCPVYLPDGSTINSATAYVKDSGVELVAVGLHRVDLISTTHYYLGTSNSDGLGSGNVEIDINSINEVVDNSQNNYNLSVLFTGSGSGYDFHGAVINYTYTEPY